MKAGRAVLLFAFGAVGGSGLDALHVHSGTTVYARPWVFEMSPWVPLIFGLVGLSVGVSYPLAERFTGLRADRRPSWTEVSIGFAVFAGLYAMSGYLPTSNLVRLVLIALGAAGLFLWLARTKLALALAVVAAVIGPLAESALVHAGFFAYRYPDAMGVTMWLPALYAGGSVAFGTLGHKVMGGEPSAAVPERSSSKGGRGLGAPAG
jgi:hypothetical protein